MIHSKSQRAIALLCFGLSGAAIAAGPLVQSSQPSPPLVAAEAATLSTRLASEEIALRAERAAYPGYFRQAYARLSADSAWHARSARLHPEPLAPAAARRARC